MYGIPRGLSRSRVLPRIVAPKRRLSVEQLESRRLLAPVLISPAAAAVDPGGMTVALAVVAADAVSGNVLTYTWSATGPAQPTFGAANGTSNGAELVATCSQIGTYGFTVTIANQYGEALTSSTVPSATSPAPNAVSVTLQHQTLVTSSPNYAWYPQLHRMANGNLLLWVQIAPDECIMDGTTPFEHLFLSSDNGQTWVDDGISAFHTHCMVTLSDGTFYGLWFWTNGNGSMLTTKAIRSTDNGLTFSIDEDVPIYFDGADFGPQGIGTDWGCDGGLMQMPNGDLLATIYGGPDGSIPSRSVLIRSTDDGNTWHYLSTIAFDPNQPDEGYDEPSLIDLGGDRLLSTLRTGVTMYQAVSADGGLTWSAPSPIASFGVEPDLVRTADGILVCSSGDGHPNLAVYVMCSGDGLGQQWGPQTFLYRSGAEGQLTTGYTAMAQVGPNQILVVFDNYTSARQPAGPDEVFADVLDVQRLPMLISSVSGLTTTKSGGTARFSVALPSQPEADVTLRVSSSDPTEGSVSPASLTFTPANWDAPQQVVVTGQDDLQADGNVGYTIDLGPAVSSDPAFNWTACPSVFVTNQDDRSCVWTGAGGDGKWTNAANWLNSTAPQPGDDLFFSGTTPTRVANDFPAGTSFHAVVFEAGDFSLSGNPYDGPTTIAATATLQVGAGGTDGALGTGAIDDEGTLLFACAGSVTVANTIYGAGSLIQAGGGVLILSADDSYGGGTVVRNGTVLVTNHAGSGTGAGAVTVASGSTLGGFGLIGNGAGSLTVNGMLQPHVVPGGMSQLTFTNSSSAGLTLNDGAALNFDFATSGVSDSIQVNGNLTLANGAAIQLLADQVDAWTVGSAYNFLDYSGSLIGAGTIVPPPPAAGVQFLVDTSSSPGHVLLRVLDTTDYFNAAASSWNSTADWSLLASTATPNPAAVPGTNDIAQFNSATVRSSQTVTLDGAQAALALHFSSSGSVTLDTGTGSHALTLGAPGPATSGIVVSAGAGNVTINAPVVLNANQAWVNNSACLLTVNGNVTGSAGGNYALTLSGSGSQAIGGSIGDPAGGRTAMIVHGGTITLSGTDTYSGGTVVDGGTLVAVNAQALPGGTCLTIGAGGTFLFDPSQSAASLSPAIPATAGGSVETLADSTTLATAVNNAMQPAPVVAHVAIVPLPAGPLPAQSTCHSPSRTSRAAEQAVDRVMAARDWRQVFAAAATSIGKPRHQGSSAPDTLLFDADGRPVLHVGSR